MTLKNDTEVIYLNKDEMKKVEKLHHDLLMTIKTFYENTNDEKGFHMFFCSVAYTLNSIIVSFDLDRNHFLNDLACLTNEIYFASTKESHQKTCSNKVH